MTRNFDATRVDGAPLYCIVCEREIPGGNWFARIKAGEVRVGLCRPWCAEKFAVDPAGYLPKMSGNPIIPIEFNAGEARLLAA